MAPSQFLCNGIDPATSANQIRELFHTGGAFVVMESVFDPAKRDQEGRAVSYVNTGGRRMVRRYDFPRDLEN